jgi:hypothetical protein
LAGGLVSCGGHAATMGRMTPAVVTLPGTAPQAGTVVLPAGSTLSLTSLTVKNSLSLTSPGADGSYTLPQFTGGPQFAFVTNPAGDAILAGFVGPSSTTIDVTSTAKVFIYWSAGFFTLPSPYRAQVVDAISTQPGFSAVVTAFQNSLAGNQDPFQHAMGRMAVMQAIQNFTQSLYTASHRSTPLGHVLRAANQARRPSAAGTPGITPTTAQSGITATLDSPPGVHFTNTYRRLAEAFFDEDSYVDASGNRQSKQVTDAAPPQRIPAVSGLGNITGGPITVALQLLGGTTPYTPVSTPSVPLAIEPGSQSTRYIVTVVGGGGSVQMPGPLTQEHSAAQQSIVVQQLVQDYLVPLVASIAIPINSTQIDDYFASAGGGSALTDIVTSIETAAPQIVPVASSGQIGDALVLGMQTVAPNPAMQTQLLTLVGNLISSTAGSEAATAFQNGFSPLYALDVLSSVVNSNDTAVATANITASNTVDVFVVDVGTGSITLSPVTANVPAGTQATFTVTAPAAGAGQTLVYDWTNTAKFGHTTDGTSGHTDTFESSSNAVTYTASATGNGADTITVTAFLIQGSTRTQIGVPATSTANAGKCPFAGVFVGPLTDGRQTPPLVSTYTLTVTCSPPNNVQNSWSDPSYGTGGWSAIAVGHTVLIPGDPNGATSVYSADYNTINGTELDAKETDVLTRTSGP